MKEPSGNSNFNSPEFDAQGCRFQAGGAEHDIHPFIATKLSASGKQFLHIDVGHLNRFEAADDERAGGSSGFIFQLEDAPYSATEEFLVASDDLVVNYQIFDVEVHQKALIDVVSLVKLALLGLW